MGGAIMGGIFRSGMDISLFACDTNQERLQELQSSYGVTPASSISTLLTSCECVFLVVKPQSFPDVLEEMRRDIPQEMLIVSIAAGITEHTISDALGYPAKVVQVMPNTPLLLGYGASALAKGSQVSEAEFDFVRQIFSCAGIAEEIPAEKMNEIIAINGSSPAFIYEFTKYFVEYASSNGIDADVALKLFAQSLIGSAKMLTESGYSVDRLIEMVSSKGGTTIAGLDAFRKKGLGEAVLAGCDACTKRAYELAK